MEILKTSEVKSKTIEEAITDGLVRVKESNVPMVLLEILVYGIEEDKPKIDAMNKEIQHQMSLKRNGNKARILWYIDKGEKTDEEKKQWLFENAVSKYTIFTPVDYKVKKDWYQNVILSIKNLEKIIKSSQLIGLKLNKNKSNKK